MLQARQRCYLQLRSLRPWKAGNIPAMLQTQCAGHGAKAGTVVSRGQSGLLLHRQGEEAPQTVSMNHCELAAVDAIRPIPGYHEVAASK